MFIFLSYILENSSHAALSPRIHNLILAAQANEITEYHLYKKLQKREKNSHNQDILGQIADDEMRHYEFFKTLSKTDIRPNFWKVWKYYVISRCVGQTFGIMLMEREEENAQAQYLEISHVVPEVATIIQEEQEHETKLVALLEEEKLRYIGSIVLGLNDALVELTGALAGLTFALQNTRIIAAVGFVTGIAASFSMAASEYLSIKSEGENLSPSKAALYTGLAYILVVFFLIAPFLIVSNVYYCLLWTLLNAMCIIFCFTYYTAVAQKLPFYRRFFEMVAMSLGVALLSFGIGLLARYYFAIDML